MTYLPSLECELKIETILEIIGSSARRSLLPEGASALAWLR